MPSTTLRDNYSFEEVVVLVEEYIELSALRATRPGIQVRLLDIDVALRKLDNVLREALFLCGIAGLTSRTAGKGVGVSKTIMRQRYVKGMDALHLVINGGRYYPTDIQH